MLLLPFPVELWTLFESSKKGERTVKRKCELLQNSFDQCWLCWRHDGDERKTREEEKLLRANSGGKWEIYNMHNTKFLYLMKNLCSLSLQFLYPCFYSFTFHLVLSLRESWAFLSSCRCFSHIRILRVFWVVSEWERRTEHLVLRWFTSLHGIFSLYIRRQSIDSHPCAIVLRDSQTNTFIHYTKRTRIMIFSSRLWVFYESENQRERAKKREHGATTEKKTFPPLIRIELVNQNVSREFGAVIKNNKKFTQFFILKGKSQI